MEDFHFEPLKRPRKRRFNGDQSEDAQGQLVEYDHGYLREQAKKARGVSKAGLRRGPKAPLFSPEVVADCGTELLYEFELGALPATSSEPLSLSLWWRPAGKPGPLQPVALGFETTAPTTIDQSLLKFLYPLRARTDNPRGNRFLVPIDKQSAFCGLLEGVVTGDGVTRLRWSARRQESGIWRLHRLDFGGERPWFAAWDRNPDDRLHPMRPKIWIGAETADLAIADWQAFSSAGWAIAQNTLYRLAVKNAGGLLARLTGKPAEWLTRGEAIEIGELLAIDGGADLSQMEAAERCGMIEATPTGALYITTARFKHLGQEQLQCRLSFNYAGTVCEENDPAPRLLGVHAVIPRMPQEEERLKNDLLKLGFRNVTRMGGDEDPGWKLLPSQLDGAVRALVMLGWEVRAEGKSYRRPTEKSSFGVAASGLDWLDLKATLDFGDGLAVQLPELLQAAKRGAKSVRLDDGTYGILPTEWLEKFTVLVEIGESDSERVRFRQEQSAVLQALLQEQLTDLDGRYSAALAALEEAEANGVETGTTVKPPEWFRASLRDYQLQALRWLTKLETRGLSGVLADDMGLGKTVEVLSLLSRRHEDAPAAPSLVVMPSSLLFNWTNEAAKFAPQLKTGCYYGAGRSAAPEWFAQYDVVFTTYGTLRQDFLRLARLPFDYVILDESQAIKNADSATAKATCTLKAAHRLAMTGTPIENHLAELFSQLTFLNPGLFRQSFTTALGKEGTLLHNPETLRRLRKAVSPFLLRRRKEQVAPELPQKTEQILWCELDPIQRAHYDELRDYYRKSLAKAPAAANAGTVNMLGALLRLRQAACHAGLVNESCRANDSAKLTLLHEKLGDLLAAGHKALVFSQFTTLLKMVETNLQKEGWKYCYLDGETKDRAEIVRKFQEDAEVGVFLISLKAGGVGLNLTAADYVFLLDPWWNPAAEAQAIDRTYRIGQTRPVFAYRMIAKDTVEEKVLQMQQRKRQIATAALGKTPSAADALELPPELTAEELRGLLEE